MSLGYHTVNPFMFVEGADGLIAFLGKTFAAVETERISRPDGAVGHAEVRIGDSVLMLSEAGGEFQATRCAQYVFVEDVDGAYARALAAGASGLRSPSDQFYGNREAGVRDAWGNIWWIATVIEDVSAQEIQQRWAQSQQVPGPDSV